MRDSDILKLAVLTLKADELEECFLRAFHRLAPADRELLEGLGLAVMERLDVQPPEALELIGHTVIYLNTHKVVGVPCSPR
jgi:hypothetical protein